MPDDASIRLDSGHHRAPQTFYPRAWLYLSLALVVVVAGFFPSYFGRLDAMDRAYHLHGITATL